MAAFGETVLAWRLARGLTQAQLATAARVPRPNLSAIERGDREVTLKTLRMLALALDVRPGLLADGTLPGNVAKEIGRVGLERIARGAAGGRAPGDVREAALAQVLARSARSSLVAGRKRQRRGAPPLAGGDRAYFLLRAAAPPNTLASLFGRLHDELRRQ